MSLYLPQAQLVYEAGQIKGSIAMSHPDRLHSGRPGDDGARHLCYGGPNDNRAPDHLLEMVRRHKPPLQLYTTEFGVCTTQIGAAGHVCWTPSRGQTRTSSVRPDDVCDRGQSMLSLLRHLLTQSIRLFCRSRSSS